MVYKAKFNTFQNIFIKRSKYFEILMGDQVEPRREFLDENAKLVSNLDI